MVSQRIILGDCIDVFRDVRGLQAIVSDPPAGIGFMGRSWDKDRGGRSAWIAYWAERFAVAKDACEENAVALIWALPRTSRWTATAVEDAGWRIKDVITHHFGQGWPKDKNALKPASEHWILAVKGKPTLGIDACRVERGEKLVRPPIARDDNTVLGKGLGVGRQNEPSGSWPTNLVLSHFASNDGSLCCEQSGTRNVRSGARPNCAGASYGQGDRRVFRDTAERTYRPLPCNEDGTETVPAYQCVASCECGRAWLAESGEAEPRCECGEPGTWACPIAEMDANGGSGRKGEMPKRGSGLGYGGGNGFERDRRVVIEEDTCTVSRFFPRFSYHAKAPSSERHAGCDDLFWRADKNDPFGFVRVTREEWEALSGGDHLGGTSNGQDNRPGAQVKGQRARGNVHPTVKRLSLMRWLHALTGAKRIGDLCGGSGSGAVAAYLDGIDWIGAEVCPQAVEITNARLAWWRSLDDAAKLAFNAGKPFATVAKGAHK